MIPQIKEIEGKFPKYATLSQATVTLNDMGDKTISTQIKIDGGIAPDFSYDWEVEFQGERYIQPLREPQASKGNDSLCSVIDLTFYHKTIYDLKRYFFVEMASTGSGTAMADKYIADLNVNLEQFKVALQGVLDFYFKGENRIEVKLYGEGTGMYAQEPQYVQIQYTHIWDVVQKIYDLFGVRWSIEGREIKIGYPTEEVAHTFEYGFEGGLLKVERQVQSADIRNSLLGRGGSKNLPRLYFKDLDKYGETEENGDWTPDPDAIPELRNIYFTELRGKTFRDYVQGWKTNPNRDLSYGDVVEEYDEERGKKPEGDAPDYGWAYRKGHEDEKFNPVEYVEDKDSIDKYGLLQDGLENQEDIYPTIQGVEVDGLGRVDEIVAAEQVLVDEPTSDSASVDEKYSQDIVGTFTTQLSNVNNSTKYHCSFRTDEFEITDSTIIPYLVSDPNIEAIWSVREDLVRCYGTKYEQCRKYGRTGRYNLKMSNLSVALFFADSHEQLFNPSTLQTGVKYYIRLEADVQGFPQEKNTLEYDGVTNTYRGEMISIAKEGILAVNYSWVVKNIPYNGLILKASEDDAKTIEIEAGDSKVVTFTTDNFTIPSSGATNVTVPINIVTTAQGLYDSTTIVKAIDVQTNNQVSSINIPEGEYKLRVSVSITNYSDKKETFKVEKLNAYILLPTDSEDFKPTFDIWVKNIWNTTRNEGESDQAYVDRVWTPILGDREGNEAKVVFTTGWLAGHSDYEFVIRNVEYAGGSGVELDGVPAEWKITLIKSDAEIEAKGKWIPSTTQQAVKGEKFFFIGIDMPHEYTLWAEQAVDNYKSDQLLETAHIKPTWVVQTDKVRLNQLQEGESELLLNALKIGNSLRLADTRFTNGVAQTLYLQSVTYNWQEGTNIVPDVEVVLSDKVTTSANPVAKLQGEVDALTKQVGSISNIQQVVRVVGDKLYLRKDGFEETSNSPTKFNKLVSSRDYRQGAVGGNGWGLRSEQGKGIFEVDKLIVRDEMQVNSLVVNQVSAIGGKEILSAASITCSRVETTEQGFKCYFDQKRGSVANLFVVNDIAYSQVFNANDITVKFYKREVIEVGDNYILLSLEGDGNGAPQEGDVIAQYGNTENVNRQYVIIRDVIGGGYERMLSDLNSVNAEGVEYYFAGRMQGGTPRWFVGNADGDFAEWKDGTLNIKGKVVFQQGSSGLENLEEWAEKQQQIDNTLAEAKSYTDIVVKDLQDQLDGKVESFFYDYDPTTSNIPASEWTTDELKGEHLNDTFTNTESGRSWRWLEKDGVYQWVEIADTQSAEALAKAQEALGVANGKVAVFVTDTIPVSPYNEKDLWLKDGRIYRSTSTRTIIGATYQEDWILAENSHEYADSLAENLNKSKSKVWFSEEYTSNNAPQEGVKLGDLFIPWDARHQLYSYTERDWELTSDKTQTTINGGLITSGTIQLGDTETTAKAGITGGGTSEESVRIWAGSGKENKDNAPFRVMQDGRVVAENADIKGKITTTEGELEKVVVKGSIRSPFSEYYEGYIPETNTRYEKISDNYISKEFTEQPEYSTVINLPTDIEEADGRRITLVGNFHISPKTPTTFYENGRESKSLNVFFEVVELLGFSVPSTDTYGERVFKGWIVLSRQRINSNYPYGKNATALAMGKVNANGTSIIKTFDGSQLTVQHTQTGHYSIDIPSTWMESVNNCLVMSSIFYENNSIGAVSIVTIRDTVNSKIIFRTFTGGGGIVDGNFEFMIYPLNTWN